MASPRPLTLSSLPKELMNSYLGALSDARSLSNLACTCLKNRDICRKIRSAQELLHCVLNSSEANKKRIVELITADPSIILMPVAGKEVYPIKDGKTDIKNDRGVTTPLEAAARCGDMPVVKMMFATIPMSQKQTAIDRLQALKKPGATPTDTHSYAFWGLPELRAAYPVYLERAAAAQATRGFDAVKQLYGDLGDTQKNLPWFLLQIFCRPLPLGTLAHFATLPPDFTVEPKRDCIVASTDGLDAIPLDVASLGRGTFTALYKGWWVSPRSLSVRAGELTKRFMTLARADSLVMTTLETVLTSELDKIIQAELKLVVEISPSVNSLAGHPVSL